MEEENESIDLYNDLDWSTVIECAYSTLTTLAVDFLPTQETVNLMVSIIDEAKMSGRDLPVPSERNASTAQACILGRVSGIVNAKADGLASDTAEYKMFSDIRVLIFNIVANRKTFEMLLTSTLRFHDMVHRL